MAKDMRNRIPAVTLADLGAVDAALETIGALESDAARIEAECQERVSAIRSEYDPRRDSLLETREETLALVKAFADSHPELFESPRHQDLPHGKIGYRKVESIRFRRSLETVIAALESRRLYDAITVVKKPNKDVLSAYPDEVLAGVGAKRVTKDEFYCDCRTAAVPQATKRGA